MTSWERERERASMEERTKFYIFVSLIALCSCLLNKRPTFLSCTEPCNLCNWRLPWYLIFHFQKVCCFISLHCALQSLCGCKLCECVDVSKGVMRWGRYWGGGWQWQVPIKNTQRGFRRGAGGWISEGLRFYIKFTETKLRYYHLKFSKSKDGKMWVGEESCFTMAAESFSEA